MKKLLLLLCFAASTAHAQEKWETDYSISGYQIAKITNAEDSAAGLICNVSNQACDAYLVTDTSCKEKALYPIMINSPLGAFAISGKCLTVGNTQLLVIVEKESAIEAFRSGGEIGFAIPMASGAFMVFRFSTVGAAAAIEAARTMPSRKTPKAKTRSVETL